MLTAGSEGHGTKATADSGDDSEGAPTWLALVALVLGALGLLLGGLALGRSRRSA